MARACPVSALEPRASLEGGRSPPRRDSPLQGQASRVPLFSLEQALGPTGHRFLQPHTNCTLDATLDFPSLHFSF